MRKVIEKTVTYFLKRPFTFDKNVPLSYILQLVYRKSICLLRGIFKFRKKVFLGRQSNILCRRSIQLGESVTIGDYVTMDALSHNKGISIGNYSKISSNSYLMVSGSLSCLGDGISIGNNVGVGEFAYIGGAGGVSIGDNTIVGQYLSVHSEDHQFSEPNSLIRLQGVKRQGINIGSNCWIGAKVTFCDGSAIGNDCVVAAGSVVTKKFGDHCLIGGVPAKVIRNIGNE